MEQVIKFPSASNINIGFDKLKSKINKKEFRFSNKTKIDIFNIEIPKEYNVDLARLMFEYNCEFIGISEDRLSILNSIINTGYFIKENLSSNQYYEFFRSLLEKTDFNFIILDNTYKNSISRHKSIDFYVIKPLYFNNNYFYFKKLKSRFVEPSSLEFALNNNLNIWEQSSIRIQDISNFEVGFRLPSTNRERQFLKLYNDILSRRLLGFYREVF